MRSHYCGEVTSKDLNSDISICGWVHRRRDHGGIIFLDIRDIKGICQVVVNPENKVAFDTAYVLNMGNRRSFRRFIAKISSS